MHKCPHAATNTNMYTPRDTQSIDNGRVLASPRLSDVLVACMYRRIYGYSHRITHAQTHTHSQMYTGTHNRQRITQTLTLVNHYTCTYICTFTFTVRPTLLRIHTGIDIAFDTDIYALTCTLHLYLHLHLHLLLHKN